MTNHDKPIWLWLKMGLKLKEPPTFSCLIWCCLTFHAFWTNPSRQTFEHEAMLESKKKSIAEQQELRNTLVLWLNSKTIAISNDPCCMVWCSHDVCRMLSAVFESSSFPMFGQTICLFSHCQGGQPQADEFHLWQESHYPRGFPFCTVSKQTLGQCVCTV